MSLNLLKQPLNVLEGPVYPFIQKDPPRFVWSKKHWTAHVGDIIRETETKPQTYDHAVLAVSRSENQTRYGAKSYTPKVNKAFRPPLEFMDPHARLPLSRMPHPTVVGRINPGSTKVYHSQNEHDMDVSSMIDHSRIGASVRPTYYFRLDKSDPKELYGTVHPLTQKLHASGKSGINTPIHVTEGQSPLDQTVLDFHNPQVSPVSPLQIPINLNQQSSLEDLHLEYHNPIAAPRSNPSAPYICHQKTPNEFLELQKINPTSEPINAGMNTPINLNQETPLRFLELEQKITVKGANINPSIHFNKTNYNIQDTKASSNPKLRVEYQTTSLIPYRANNTDRNVTLKEARYYSENGYHPQVTMPGPRQILRVILKPKRGLVVKKV